MDNTVRLLIVSSRGREEAGGWCWGGRPRPVRFRGPLRHNWPLCCSTPRTSGRPHREAAPRRWTHTALRAVPRVCLARAPLTEVRSLCFLPRPRLPGEHTGPAAGQGVGALASHVCSVVTSPVTLFLFKWVQLQLPFLSHSSSNFVQLIQC